MSRAARLDLERPSVAVEFGYAHVGIERNRLTYDCRPLTNSQGC
jgi:hypothetical protein